MVDLTDVDALVEVADDNLAYLNTTIGHYAVGSPLQLALDAKRGRIQRGRDWLSSMLAAERAATEKKT